MIAIKGIFVKRSSRIKMCKVVQLANKNGKVLFTLPNKSFINLVSPNGDSKTVMCEYVSDTVIRVDDTEYSVSEFVEDMVASGIWIRPVGTPVS